MGLVSGIVVFMCIWWSIIFCVLPIGVQRNEAADGNPLEGDPGAPQDPMLKKKFILTTILACVIWLIIFALVESEVISFREMAEQMAAGQ